MKSKFIFRQNAKHLSFRKRHISLSSIEQVRIKRLKKIIQAVMCKIYKTEDPLEREDLNHMLDAVVMKYLSIKVVEDDGMEQCGRYNRTIESFSPSDCKICFLNLRRKIYSDYFIFFNFQILVDLIINLSCQEKKFS